MSLKDNTTTKPTTQILMHGLPMVSAELYERERDKARVLVRAAAAMGEKL